MLGIGFEGSREFDGWIARVMGEEMWRQAHMSTDVVVVVGTGEGICSSRQQVGAGCEGS